jgi:hypothetical protein
MAAAGEEAPGAPSGEEPPFPPVLLLFTRYDTLVALAALPAAGSCRVWEGRKGVGPRVLALMIHSPCWEGAGLGFMAVLDLGFSRDWIGVEITSIWEGFKVSLIRRSPKKASI